MHNFLHYRNHPFKLKLQGFGEITGSLSRLKEANDFEIENSTKDKCSIFAKLYHNNHI